MSPGGELAPSVAVLSVSEIGEAATVSPQRGDRARTSNDDIAMRQNKTIAIEAIVFVNSAKTIRWRRLIASCGELSTVSY